MEETMGLVPRTVGTSASKGNSLGSRALGGGPGGLVMGGGEVEALTIFLSAFLLFQVELIVGKELLPWFGGAPSVWTTCLVFFQSVLLAGYAYAHLIVSKLGLPRQLGVHIVVVALSVLLLACLATRWPSPITPGSSWKPAGEAEPVGQLITLLAVSVGIPFFVLSTTGPLLQKWSVISRPGRSPYRLYALSNAGSLVGLLGYPFLVEPFLGIRDQALAWSGLFSGLNASLASQIASDGAVLLAGCMVCHGELVRAKPGVAHLTGFYLAVAAGGALGGLGVAIAAASTPWDSTSYRVIRPWTDDFSNLITVLKKSEEDP